MCFRNTTLVFTTICTLMLSSVAMAREESKVKVMRSRLKSIVIPRLSFEEVPVSTVFHYLKQRSRVLDPQSVGVNFMLLLKKPDEKNHKEPLVTLDLDNVPLDAAIRYVCTTAGLQHKVEPNAVVVMAPGVTRKSLELRIYSVDPRIFSNVKDVQKFFEEKGVTFPTSTTK